MKLDEAKEKLIQAWGSLGTQWGINRTMGSIHALLLVSPESMTTEEIMEQLNISRGNANMNIRALIDWGLVLRENKSGERKEYFYARKDIWEITTRIARERRKRELEPVIQLLQEVKDVEGSTKDAEEFKRMARDLEQFTLRLDKMMQKVEQSNENWFLNILMRMI